MATASPKSGKVFLAATTLAAGNGGIARVARLMGRVLAADGLLDQSFQRL